MIRLSIYIFLRLNHMELHISNSLNQKILCSLSNKMFEHVLVDKLEKTTARYFSLRFKISKLFCLFEFDY